MRAGRTTCGYLWVWVIVPVGSDVSVAVAHSRRDVLLPRHLLRENGIRWDGMEEG